ncbi:hypothetical protein Goari_010327 [Gossypium aridum]|uniref:Uncharacterized protein n=1 Tax=Gossypium aridum TaxID=34290 RepID=A0A7J8Y010_GOSAI|nr:hypothetical protein [Gossypium aridum]
MGLMGLVATSAYVKGSSILGIIPRALKKMHYVDQPSVENYQFGVFLND